MVIITTMGKKLRKQKIEKSETPKKSSYTKILAYTLIIFGCFISAIAFVVWRQEPSESEPPPPIPQVLSPNETQPPAPVAKPTKKEVKSYDVAPTLPKYISIPKIGIQEARILSLGTRSDGHIDTPKTAYDTGWYNKSAKPGQQGATFIDGHVAGYGGGGIFYNLHKLKAGDQITITRGDNKIYVYKVVSIKTYSASRVDMNTVLSPVDPKKPGLNLMTCTWDVVQGKSVFKNRVVVFASLSL